MVPTVRDHSGVVGQVTKMGGRALKLLSPGMGGLAFRPFFLRDKGAVALLYKSKFMERNRFEKESHILPIIIT